MATLRLFAQAKDAAGCSTDHIDGATVGEIVDAAVRRYGESFGAVLATAKVWVNGEPASADAPVTEGDEVAVLPPVSGGAG